ncbi:efflux RND transporter periplasmic adaptor subunit [Winogradskyella endarachnes]|uniref:Efflux RND transporter periplasmic adaptor subunit n=1 Tax=Winogradskyella endarachnes TaxID=2681965 RepID=A0A6L6U8F9_9FLAO|nr:efflux RND transporter periplasmic adaptor subunit [Winogradskyella endarachnes]MUU77162.1 efflux RND transporter periplasmic adaptor subunit [Winogradskyella endarachnes]
MKTNKKILIAGISVAIIALVLYNIFKPSETVLVEAKTITVTTGDVTTLVTATGTIEPITQVDVGTQVSGVVEKIYVDYNSEVKEGQLIAELDKTNLKAAVVEAQANYDSAISQKIYTETIYNRQKTLYDNQVISKADFDDALYDYQTAKNTVTQRYSLLQTAKTNLGYANIYSPIDGVVLSRDIDEGQTVAASYSTPTLFTIAQDLKEMQVEADVDEADIGNVREGQRVTFTVDAYIGQTFEGEVTQVRLNPTTTSNVVTYTVVIKAHNPDLKLKPGLTATISIYTLELKDVLTTEAKAVNFKPDPAIMAQYIEQNNLTMPERPQNGGPENNNEQPDEEMTMLWVLNNDKSITPKPAKLGASDGVNVQILEGISKGEQLVYSLKGGSAAAPSGAPQGSNESPFMPKPPGAKK